MLDEPSLANPHLGNVNIDGRRPCVTLSLLETFRPGESLSAMRNSKPGKRTQKRKPRRARTGALRHASDCEPGITRRRAGRGFVYLDAKGARVRDEATLARVRALAIPPAYTASGSAPTAAATCRQPAAMRAGASSTATTWRGSIGAMQGNIGACCASPNGFRHCARASAATAGSVACRATRCWRS